MGPEKLESKRGEGGKRKKPKEGKKVLGGHKKLTVKGAKKVKSEEGRKKDKQTEYKKTVIPNEAEDRKGAQTGARLGRSQDLKNNKRKMNG